MDNETFGPMNETFLFPNPSSPVKFTFEDVEANEKMADIFFYFTMAFIATGLTGNSMVWVLIR